MTDLETIAYFVNAGEMFATAHQSNKGRLQEKDVYYIQELGEPTGGNVDYVYRVLACTRERLIISGIKDFKVWLPYFNRSGVEYMEVDEQTVVFGKEL
jgi:hypothetical protein